jgi:hypothetical protein
VRRSPRPRRGSRSMLSNLLPDLGNWILPVMLADGSQIRRLAPPGLACFFLARPQPTPGQGPSSWVGNVPAQSLASRPSLCYA